MALPKIVTPEFETVIPSTKESIKFRPFLVKEEKILYMALEGGDEKTIEQAINNVLGSCILSDTDTKKLASYDIEYLFLQLRSKSVGETVELNLQHGNAIECKHITKYKLSVEDIQVVFNDKHKYTVKIDDKYGIKLKDPSMSDVINNIGEKKTEYESVINIISNCVVCVYDEDNVYDDFTKDEMEEFLSNLTQTQFKGIQDFFETLPKLEHKIEWVCKECGKEESLLLEGMKSFFM